MNKNITNIAKEIIINNLCFGNKKYKLKNISFETNNSTDIVKSIVEPSSSNNIIYSFNKENNSNENIKIKEVRLLSEFENQIPTMSSNTYPEGLCFAKFEKYSYKAFDDNYKTEISFKCDCEDFVGYIFNEEKNIKQINIILKNVNNFKCIVQTSNDTTNGFDGEWNTASNEFTCKINENFKLPLFINRFKAFRIVSLEGSSSIVSCSTTQTNIFAKFNTDVELKPNENWIDSTKLNISTK